MPRDMTSAMEAALCAPVLRPALLAAMQFAGSTGYAWTGLGPLAWNGMTFEGVGDLGEIDGISEDSSVEARGVTLKLSGIRPDMMTEVLTETRILGRVQVWLALFDANGALIPDPILSYQGLMDQPSLDDDGKSCTAQIAVENVLVDLNRPCYRRFTNADQQMDYPGDTGLQYVAGLQEQITFWGTSPGSINNV